MLFRRIARCGIAISVTFFGIGTYASAQQNFYAGKTIQFYVGAAPGEGFDVYSRLIAPYLGKHIQGNPTIIMKNMPAAGSMVLANYLYVQAAKDGTEIGMLNQGIVASQALSEPGVQFDARRMNWIGSPESTVDVAFSWYASPIKTIYDAMQHELVMGATGAGSPTTYYPMLMNEILGTKFKIIEGYISNQLNLALERGEVGGRGAFNWDNLRDGTSWVRDKKVQILVQMGAERAPDLPNVPLMHELAKTPDDRSILEFVSLAPSMGRPIVAPPGVSPERVKLLQDAFEATLKDPAFLEQAKVAKLTISPSSGATLSTIVKRTLDISPALAQKAEKMISRGTH